MQFVSAADGEVPAPFTVHPAIAARAIEAAIRHRDAAEDHWLVVRDGEVRARASVWWRETPRHAGGRVGFVGHYAAADATSGAALLRHVAGVLARHGCATVVGPVDGNTWHAYRLVTARGIVPPFFLEPDTPDDWPDHFRAAGFDVLATYTSAVVDTLPPPSDALEARAVHLEADGYRLRPLDLTRSAAELDALYDVSIAAFADNFLYTPISRQEFHAQYGALLPHADPRLVLLAERHGVVAGYVFLIADLLERRRTGTTSTAILKTLAVHPDHAGAGLGGLLVERGQRAAVALGLTRIIHALMLETNLSQRISRHYGAPFRRYAVFARPATS